MNSIIENITKKISEYNTVHKLFLSSHTYLKILEEEKSVKKEDGKLEWDKPLPIKYLDNKPLWGEIPIEIDDDCHEWAISGDK